MLRLTLALCCLTLAGCAPSPQFDNEVPGHLVVVYRNHQVPRNATQIAASSGAIVTTTLPQLGLSTIATTPGNEDAVILSLEQNPEVETVLHDRYVTGHALQILQQPQSSPPQLSVYAPPPIGGADPYPILRGPIVAVQPPSSADSLYNSPQGWAVLQSGGFGSNIPNPSTLESGPWNTSMGSGIRIAVVDSGIDATHPDLAPNLVLNLSEINQDAQTGLPSACDTGSPQDQQGHGTFTASLAAAAVGPATGKLIGVAPQASLLNIKVLERTAGAGETLQAQCEAGQATGLLSWVLQGIQDAQANHANVISLSLGTLIDTATGDGAGWKAQFDRVTYAATQSGSIIVAALGNDGLNLNGTLIELPAQARSVLAVTATTNPACAEDLTPNAVCKPGPVSRPSYSNFGVANAIAAPGGSYPQGSLDTPSVASGFVTGACSSGLPNTTDGLPTTPNESFGCFNQGHQQYVQAIGTSASAPLVAGAAALLQAAHLNWTATQIIAALRSTATPSSATNPQLNLLAAITNP